MSVVLGTHNLKKINNDMRYSIKKCKHPEYVDIKSGNDIMLLKVSIYSKKQLYHYNSNILDNLKSGGEKGQL